jgi:hypothetical protein
MAYGECRQRKMDSRSAVVGTFDIYGRRGPRRSNSKGCSNKVPGIRINRTSHDMPLPLPSILLSASGCLVPPRPWTTRHKILLRIVRWCSSARTYQYSSSGRLCGYEFKGGLLVVEDLFVPARKRRLMKVDEGRMMGTRLPKLALRSSPPKYSPTQTILPQHITTKLQRHSYT